jgi:hypothetical protein
LSIVIQKTRQLRMQKTETRLVRRWAVLSFDYSSALQPDLRILWNTSIFHLKAYHSSFSMASAREPTGRSVNALAHGAPDLRHQLAEPLVQTRVGKAAASKLAIKPCVRSPVHWHRSLRDSVPDKESRPIPATQRFVRSLSDLD